MVKVARQEAETSAVREHQRLIREKRACLRQAHGGAGLISATELAKEIGVADYRTARKWADTVGLRRTGTTGSVKYDIDHLAKILVERMSAE